jgi:predicted branched-subunit amino acid permease
MLYGMFVAIIVPPAKKDKHIVFALFVAGIFSSIFKVFVPQMTSGFAVIIAALGAAVLAAILFPVSEREIEEEGGRA